MRVQNMLVMVMVIVMNGDSDGKMMQGCEGEMVLKGEWI